MKIYRLLPGLLLYSFTGFSQNPDSLYTLAQKIAETDTQKVNLLNQVGVAYWKNGDDSTAVVRHIEAIQLAKKNNFAGGEVRARLQLVRIELDYLSDLETANAHLDSAMSLALRLKDKSLEGQTLFRRAQLYASGFSEYETRAQPLFEKARLLFAEIGDKAREGMVYASLAEIAGTGGRYAEAIDLLLKARKLQEQTGNPEDLRATLPNLGVTYARVGMFAEALACFGEAEKNALLRKDERIRGFLLNQRADIRIKQGKFRDAVVLLEQAVSIQEASGAIQSLASTYARMGAALLYLKQTEQALTFTSKADSLYRAGTDAKEMMFHGAQTTFGKIYLKKKDYVQVVRYAQEGLKWAASADPPLVFEEAEYHRQLWEAYKHQGRYREALHHMESYKTLSDSLLNQESLQKISVSSVTYDFEKRRQSDLLRIRELEKARLTQSRNILVALVAAGLAALLYVLWSNRKLRDKNNLLLEKNREIVEARDKGQKIERKRVASELHDNLNTKLAAIRWQLESLQTADFTEFNLNVYTKLLKMINDAYKDVRLISHNMLPAELERDGLPAALQHLIGKLDGKESTVFHLLLTGQIGRPDAETEHQLYNIALELVNNILKHAHATEVQIALEQHAGMLVLSVTDNGIGISPGQIPSGMGIRNVINRVTQLGGKMEIENQDRGGTRVTIRIPI